MYKYKIQWQSSLKETQQYDSGIVFGLRRNTATCNTAKSEIASTVWETIRLVPAVLARWRWKALTYYSGHHVLSLRMSSIDAPLKTLSLMGRLNTNSVCLDSRGENDNVYSYILTRTSDDRPWRDSRGGGRDIIVVIVDGGKADGGEDKGVVLFSLVIAISWVVKLLAFAACTFFFSLSLFVYSLAFWELLSETIWSRRWQYRVRSSWASGQIFVRCSSPGGN